MAELDLNKLKGNQYGHTDLNRNAVNNDQFDVNKVESLATNIGTEKANKMIDKECQLQLDINNFTQLKKALQKYLTETLNSVDNTNKRNIIKYKAVLKEKIARSKNILTKENENISSLVDKIKNFDKDNEITNSVDTITFDNQSALLNQLNPITISLENAKHAISALHGSITSKDVFAEIKKEISIMKHDRTRARTEIMKIDISNENIIGYLYTPGSMFSRKKGFTHQECQIKWVNAKDKIYTVEYYESKEDKKSKQNGKTMTVTQANLCLVNNDKLKQ